MGYTHKRRRELIKRLRPLYVGGKMSLDGGKTIIEYHCDDTRKKEKSDKS